MQQPLSRVAKAAFVIVVVVPLAFTVYRANDERDRQVTISSAAAESERVLRVQTVCLPPERLRPAVRETRRTVTVTVTALDYDPANADGCLASREVRLADPLGDRRLIDGSTGREVLVSGR